MVYGALGFAWHKLTDTYWFLRFHRVLDYEQRQRSLSDSTDINSPGAFTAEKLRKTQSYTAFPHIIKKSTCFGDEPSFNFYRTSCFRIMPHLSEGSFHNEYFPTISVLSRSSQFENYPLNMTCEISSESEDSGWELEINDQTVLHTWPRPRERCPTQNLLQLSPRDGSKHGAYLIWRRNIHEARKRCTKLKRIHRGFNFPNSRWKTWEKKEVYLRWDIPEAFRSRSSLVMSLVDNYDGQICDQHFPSQEPLEAEEVMGHWVNRNRRQSISKQPSFLMVEEVDEENEAKVRVTIWIFRTLPSAS